MQHLYNLLLIGLEHILVFDYVGRHFGDVLSRLSERSLRLATARYGTDAV